MPYVPYTASRRMKMYRLLNTPKQVEADDLPMPGEDSDACPQCDRLLPAYPNIPSDKVLTEPDE